MDKLKFNLFKDAKQLKITRVRDWSICFDYKGEHYLIKGSSEIGEGQWQTLYRRTLNEHGFWSLETMATSSKGNEYLINDYFSEYKKKFPKARTIVYRYVSRAAFAKHLSRMGLAEGCYERAARKEVLQEQIHAYKNQIIEISQKLKETRQKLKETQKELNALAEQKEDLRYYGL